MDNLLLIAICVLGIGCIIAVALAVRGSRRSGADASAAEQQMRRYEESTRLLLDETRRQYERQIAALEQRLESQRAEMEERLARRDAEMSRRSALEFSNLANEALSRETASLREENLSQMESLLSPLRRRLTEFQQTVTDTYVKENSSRTALASQIETLVQANAEIGREARRLSNALRGDTRMQGEWGETVLRRLLERAGLVADVHFRMQTASLDGKSLKSDEGKAYRPDLVLLLPGDHKVIVDSKASMSDYLRYVEAEDEREAEMWLKRHVASVRKHVKELADKQYHRLVKGAMEHSLMFIPNDGSFMAALRGDDELTEYAFRHNVVIVSPAHLLSVVQLIAQLWRIERQNRNAEAIAEAGGRLYDKYAAFLADFEKIERNLQASLRAYEGCLRHISGGQQSLSARAERLREMGAKVTKKIPDAMAATADSYPIGAEAASDILSGEAGSEEE